MTAEDVETRSSAVIDRRYSLDRVSFSKDVFESELHDARRKCGTDHTESVARPIIVGLTRPEAVRHVERFSANFEPLCFTQIERSGQRHIEVPRARPNERHVANVPVRPQRGEFKSFWIKPCGHGTAGLVLVTIRCHL